MRAEPKSPVYFIFHIPKTAGETIEFHLEDHCSPGTVWRPNPPSWWTEAALSRRRERGLPDLTRVRAVVGQHIGRSLERYFPDREIRRAVLLRDPVSLQVSFYNYLNMRSLSEGGGSYSFDLHIRQLHRNFIAHTLLGKWCEIPWPLLPIMPEARKYEMLNGALAGFWFVGAHTDCDRLIAAIASDLGVPLVAWRRNTFDEWQKRVEWRAVKEDELAPATRRAILKNNPIDQALWENWSGAGFDAASVRPQPFNRTWESSFSLHSALRPIFVSVRAFLQHCWPRLEKATAFVEPVATRKSASPQSEGGWRALLAALDQDPQNPEIWRSIFTRCRKTGRKPRIPDRLVASAGDVEDADLCVLKGEVLLCCGRREAGNRLLRRAVMLAKSRRQAREMTLRAAAQDKDFQALIAAADRARDRGDWRAGERYYRAALALYPTHCSYMVQYAHCLKEQGKFAAAEIHYRSARALGAQLRDVHEHLAFVASRQSYRDSSEALSGAAWIAEPLLFLDGPPTKADVDLAYLALRGSKPGVNEVLHILRARRTVRDMLIGLIEQRPEEQEPTLSPAARLSDHGTAGQRLDKNT
jgi:tetratricopeptide (TPR) repeat protein